MPKTKPAGKSIKKASTLDKNDPRVRAIAAEILAEALKKSEMKWAAERAERAEKTIAENEARRKANIEAREKKEAKKRKSHESIVARLGKIAEPLQAIHDTAERALGDDDHEAAVVVASNLSILCLKLLEDCLNDLGDITRGNADAWLAGEAR